MNNEDRVICAREKGETEGAAAMTEGGVIVERNTAALKQVAAVLLALMRTGGPRVSTRLYNACCIAGGRRCYYL